ncbi:UNVERIFIED_CONTAM: hypothetical protein GTU68_053977 [Idotea baltica]|nr:hypothetical protein [Idotea baltica]
MLGVLRKNGFEIVNDVKRADLAVVNTCGFLQSAIEESIDCILDVGELKKTGQLRKLIVAGCVVSRFQGDIKAELPEVDAFIDTNQIPELHKILGEENDDTLPRVLSTKNHFAYVKVSEGCNRPCTFCIIPKIRGKMRSRTVDSVVKEVTQLSGLGVREVNLVAQDLTSFGKDRKEKETLSDLIVGLNKIKNIEWVRLLYAYPVGTDVELIKNISSLDKICSYIDIPLQHSSERVLKVMQRPIGRFSPRSIVKLIKDTASDVHIRTTFIVGFPGETEEDITDLEQFIREGHFSSVGIFTYSIEEGTPAGSMDMQISEEEKEARKERLMKAQKEVIIEKQKGFIGRTLKVMLEGVHDDTELLLVGRAEFQAPDVDGTVIINDSVIDMEELKQGDFVKVEITEVAEYDLIGKVTAICV